MTTVVKRGKTITVKLSALGAQALKEIADKSAGERVQYVIHKLLLLEVKHLGNEAASPRHPVFDTKNAPKKG